MPIELKNFEAQIEHKTGRDEQEAEISEVSAIKLDEADGIGVALGFTNNSLSKADYLHIEENNFIIIEASDLRDQLKECVASIAIEEAKALAALQATDPKKNKLPVKTKKPIEDRCYYSLKAELMQKWCGSIAISERLCRANGIQNHPDYSYMIVCRNGTDVKVLNRFKQKMEGTIKNIKVLTTETLAF
ncbi:hypothetical protein J0676_05920 [Vibrio sp. Vb2880]|uniref:hypothetical protein n=1 Tax=Vibrio sp. Vb2880 TaxID=2816076 RepID=UPI001A8EDFCD|nr:hypothetical protein [Vibrio sp. Vb2880]MBO0213016.1 hypothetical protein [Vibrio sp. Vb2880]